MGLEVGNLETFTNDCYCFGILEVGPGQNLSDIKASLKKQNNDNRETAVILDWLISDDTNPLQRIFKKEPLNDHLIRKIDNHKRMVMILEIENDSELLKEYIEIHKPDNIWPQVLENMDMMGIQDMELYLMDYQTFLIMDVNIDFDMEKGGAQWAALPKEQEWQQYVAKFQKTDPKNNATEKWKLMTQII